MSTNSTLFSAFLALLVLSSCNIINPDEKVPSYLRIDDISLHIPPEDVAYYGSDSEAITDAWLYVDNELVGAFELPAIIPVLKEGTQKVQVFPGIKFNGISNTRGIYRFYSFYEIEMNLYPEAVQTINPIVSYITESLSIDKENFEDPAGFNFVRSVGSDTLVQVTPNPDSSVGYLETSVAVVHIDEVRPHFKIESDLDLSIAFADPVYIEFDYKCNNPFVFGLVSIQPSNAEVGLIGINPKLDSGGDPIWNKMYIDISNAVDLIGNGSEIELYFEGQLQGTEGFIMIDNVKIIRPG